MKISRLQLLIPALLASLLPMQARAEIVTLATGEKVEGKIVSETDADLTLEIKVSASINDERVIPRKDIQKIEKVSPEDAAFQEIKNFKIDPQSSFKPEVYDRVLGALKSFLESYPAGTHVAAVQQTAADFQAEKTRVDAGEVKFLGEWLSSEEAAKKKIQIAGRQTFDLMKYQAARREWSGALNSFDLIEKKYSAARIYPDAVDLAVQTLAILQKQVADALKMIAYDQDQFKTTLSMAKPEDVSKLRASVKREQDQYAAAVAAAKNSKVKWLPFIPRSRDSVNALQAAIPGEMTRLRTLPVQKMHASVGLTDDAQAAIESGRTDNAASLIQEALKAWPQNDEALRLKEEIGALKKAEKSAVDGMNSRAAAQEQAAREKADAAAKAAVVEKLAAKPFYMTIKGALAIAGGVLVLIGGISLLGRLQKPKGPTQ